MNISSKESALVALRVIKDMHKAPDSLHRGSRGPECTRAFIIVQLQDTTSWRSWRLSTVTGLRSPSCLEAEEKNWYWYMKKKKLTCLSTWSELWMWYKDTQASQRWWLGVFAFVQGAVRYPDLHSVLTCERALVIHVRQQQKSCESNKRVFLPVGVIAQCWRRFLTPRCCIRKTDTTHSRWWGEASRVWDGASTKYLRLSRNTPYSWRSLKIFTFSPRDTVVRSSPSVDVRQAILLQTDLSYLSYHCLNKSVRDKTTSGNWKD